MTKAECTKWLAAIGKLERFYRRVVKGGEPKQFDECPLCKVYKQICDWMHVPCKGICLWYKYENKKEGCSIEEATNGRVNYNIPWAKDSLKRLARWRARLEKE